MMLDTKGATVLDRPSYPEKDSSDGSTWLDDFPGDQSSPMYSTGKTQTLSIRFTITTSQKTNLEAEFRELTNQWRHDTGHFSLVSQMTRHPAYQCIIKMGEPAIPLILKDLESQPDHWFPALASISGESPPIPDEDRGKIRAISKIWIKWGKTKGYIE